MWSFLAYLAKHFGTDHTVVVMDVEHVGKAHRYLVRPSRIALAWGGSLLVIAALVGGMLVFTPLRTFIPGYGTEEIARNARLNTLRLQSLQDSLSTQRRYIKRLRGLITGRVDSSWEGGPPSSGTRAQAPPQVPSRMAEASQETPSPHRQPALSAAGRPVAASAPRRSVAGTLSFPLPPPVESGFPTREYNAQTGHYGVDIAVSEGEYIRAVAQGYVVWADWTQDGGHTIAVQHADGYISIYKHNNRLLKRRGDRVTALEPIAVSGNTGAISTGPHLHFELWRNGLAQGPKALIAGW